MKIKSLFFLIIILSGAATFAAKSDMDLAVYANATVYNNPAFDSVSLIEFPFILNRNNFEFYKPDSTDSRFFARIFAHVELLDVSGFPIDSTNTLFTVTAKSLKDANAEDIRLFNKLSLFAKPGIYSARIIVIDVVNKNRGEFFVEKIIVEKNSKTKSVNISMLNSAFQADYVGKDSTKINPLIYKNGYNLLINPISVFANKDKSLFIYGEIYNLEYSDDVRTKYQIIINALDKDSNIYQMFGSRLSKKPGSSAIFVESIDIAGWNNGVYTIEVIVVDLATKAADTAYLPLSIVSPEAVLLAAKDIANLSDPYNSFTFQQKIQLATYILSVDELKTLNNLGEMGKENFLKVIWKEHDPTPKSKINEFRDEIITRYNYANKYFSTNEFKTNGWLTDRGRIYMEYGRWEDRKDEEAPRSGNSFVIWYYHSYKGGGLTFIFEDEYGDDDYKLVHSTAEGEVYSRVWAEWIISGFMEVIER